MARLVGALLIAAVALAAPARAAEAPRLRSYLDKATWVVSASVSEVSEHDDGRLAVAHLAIEAVLQQRGGARPPADAVEMRDLPVPDVFVAGARGIAFLRPVRRNSYLAEHLQGNAYAELVEARLAWLVAESDADLKAMNEIVAALVASRSGSGGAAKRAEENRQLVFRLLAARHPLLVEDGANSLADIAGLSASLSAAEQSAIADALGRADLPLRVRLRLIDAVAETDLRQMVPTLQGVDDPQLQEACWKALRRLGAPLNEDALDRRLEDPRAATRIAALREIVERDPGAGIARVAPLATGDADPAVRLAAIEALGKTGRGEAVPPLEKAFVGDDVEQRQTAARALLDIGGEPAAEAFYRLSFTGPVDGQRLAVVGLLAIVGKNDPRVRRIEETHSDEKIIHMLKEGFSTEH